MLDHQLESAAIFYKDCVTPQLSNNAAGTEIFNVFISDIAPYFSPLRITLHNSSYFQFISPSVSWLFQLSSYAWSGGFVVTNDAIIFSHMCPTCKFFSFWSSIFYFKFVLFVWALISFRTFISIDVRLHAVIFLPRKVLASHCDDYEAYWLDWCDTMHSDTKCQSFKGTGNFIFQDWRIIPGDGAACSLETLVLMYRATRSQHERQ